MARIVALALLVLAGCADVDEGNDVILTVENGTDRRLVHFDYAPCNTGEWRGVLEDAEPLAPGERASSAPVPAGCYDMYVEGEDGCWRENATNGNIVPGGVATWTVRGLDCE